jgi:hypothetical protein
MFDRIKTIFKSKEAPRPSAAPPPPAAAPAPAAPASAPQETKAGWKLGDISKMDQVRPVAPTKAPAQPAAAAAPAKAAPAPAPPPPKPKSVEELCGITPRMNKEEVRSKLAVLYRRYNRAAGSLDSKLRAEAEEMLDAIVAVRDKVFGPI